MDKGQVEPWLQALDDDTTGPDLEYDAGNLELSQAANGRPETQFGPAEPPSWPLARELSEGLMERTRDLRIAMLWGRAVVNLQGLQALPPALALLHGLLDRFWDMAHPRPDPDDGDTFARISALGGLDAIDGLLGDVRQALLVMDRRLGGLRVRDVEVALERLAPRPDEMASTPAQITGVLGDYPELAAQVRAAVEGSLAGLKELQRVMNDRFGMDSAPDVKALRTMLTGVQSLLPTDEAPASGLDGSDSDASGDPGDGASAGDDGGGRPAPAGPGPGRRAASGVHSVESRQDAVRAIQLICAYLERSEPTNPAQMLLRRAERLIDKNFLQLVRDFAPDALREVARVLGVDPETLNQDSE